MSRNVNQAAGSSGEITSNIAGMAATAQHTAFGANATKKVSQQLVETSAKLRQLVEQFNITGAGC
jgi:methyl-accepting chemotaxis protein